MLRVGRSCRFFDGLVTLLWVNSMFGPVLTTFSAGMDNSDIWIWDCLQTLKCDLRVHKVSSYEDPSSATDPLVEWALTDNNLVDGDTCAANESRQSWFMQIWNRFSAEWRQMETLVRSLSRLHLAVVDVSAQGFLHLISMNAAALRSWLTNTLNRCHIILVRPPRV